MGASRWILIEMCSAISSATRMLSTSMNLKSGGDCQKDTVLISRVSMLLKN
jgi:hypothetical protein